MMVEELTIDPQRLLPDEEPWVGPLVFIDLTSLEDGELPIALPPCPVVGLGEPTHPFARKIDAVVERPVSAEAVVRQVLAKPKAAAAVVQLLRVLPSLSLEEGLIVESITYAMLQGSAEHKEWLARNPIVRLARQSEGSIILRQEGQRLVIMLNRPETGNAIDRSMRDALYDAFALAAADRKNEQVSLRAMGKVYSVGADLTEFGTTTDPATAHNIRSHTLPAIQVLRCVDRLDVHVAGACVGAGLEIAAFSRRFTASPNAWFQLPELAMGILPGAGGCVSLNRRIGRQRTCLMILSGKRLSARRALEWGLIDRIIDKPA